MSRDEYEQECEGLLPPSRPYAGDTSTYTIAKLLYQPASVDMSVFY